MSKVIKNNDGVAIVEGTPAASLIKDADKFFVKLGWAEVDKDGNDLKKVSKKKVSKIKKVSKKTKK